MNSDALSNQGAPDHYKVRVRQVVDELLEKEEVFRERCYRITMILQITKLMKCNFSPEEFRAINDEDLKLWVGQLMVREFIL